MTYSQSCLACCYLATSFICISTEGLIAVFILRPHKTCIRQCKCNFAVLLHQHELSKRLLARHVLATVQLTLTSFGREQNHVQGW